MRKTGKLALAVFVALAVSSSASAHMSPIGWHDGGGYGYISHGAGIIALTQCDTQVDGNSVRLHLRWTWGDLWVSRVWAPSGDCASDMKEASMSHVSAFRVCIENEGCTGWHWDGH
jgi:hypothetical protein